MAPVILPKLLVGVSDYRHLLVRIFMSSSLLCNACIWPLLWCGHCENIISVQVMQAQESTCEVQVCHFSSNHFYSSQIPLVRSLWPSIIKSWVIVPYLPYTTGCTTHVYAACNMDGKGNQCIPSSTTATAALLKGSEPTPMKHPMKNKNDRISASTKTWRDNTTTQRLRYVY